MSTAYSTNGTEFHCDDCGAIWEPPRMGHGSERPDFMACWSWAKEEGWRSRPTGAVDRKGYKIWEHRCPTCKFIERAST